MKSLEYFDETEVEVPLERVATNVGRDIAHTSAKNGRFGEVSSRGVIVNAVVEKLKPALDSPSHDDRVEIIRYLMECEDPKDEEDLSHDEWKQAWVEEINRRVADSRSGKSVMIPGDIVMQRLREKYG